MSEHEQNQLSRQRQESLGNQKPCHAQHRALRIVSGFRILLRYTLTVDKSMTIQRLRKNKVDTVDKTKREANSNPMPEGHAFYVFFEGYNTFVIYTHSDNNTFSQALLKHLKLICSRKK